MRAYTWRGVIGLSSSGWTPGSPIDCRKACMSALRSRQGKAGGGGRGGQPRVGARWGYQRQAAVAEGKLPLEAGPPACTRLALHDVLGEGHERSSLSHTAATPTSVADNSPVHTPKYAGTPCCSPPPS